MNGIRTWGLMPFLFCLLVVLFCLMVGGIAFEWFSNGGCERNQISKQGTKFCRVSLAPRW
jgi:hypothetical protein